MWNRNEVQGKKKIVFNFSGKSFQFLQLVYRTDCYVGDLLHFTTAKSFPDANLAK